MRPRKASYGPKLFCYRWLISAMAVVFMLALGSSLVSLPFSNNLNRSRILTAQEEEAGGNNNNFNEEHKCGKSLHHNFLEFSEWLAFNNRTAIVFEFPQSVNILSSLHTSRIIQPPEC
ncbi:MAG: hypothetical protein QM664_10955 [Flavihumibacter sp.]